MSCEHYYLNTLSLIIQGYKMTTELTINNKYKLIERIGSGNFGSIYKGYNIRTAENVAIKIEAIDANVKLLKNESVIYQYLKGCVGVPSVKWFGRDEANYYMVINLLGESLQSIKNRDGSLPLSIVLKIGIKLITLLETIHNKGLVHRDIKPENFLLGPNNDIDHIHIIDFGFCRSYLLNGHHGHIPQKKTHGIIGSLTYASLNAHALTELSRRDDMESLGYVLTNLYLGTLPWQDTPVAKIEETKRLITTRYDVPPVFIKYIQNVRCLKFEETPDYTQLIKLFTSEIV
jgi:serine/threonine protein kinase